MELNNDEGKGIDFPLENGSQGQSIEYRRLLQELKTHQIELEMQNEELRRTELRLRESTRRYTDLYNFAPTGYLTLSSLGIIRDANLRASSYLGMPRNVLIGKRFSDRVVPRMSGLFLDHLNEVLNSHGPVICNLEVSNGEGSVFAAELESVSWCDENDDTPYIRSIFRDVTERNAIEKELITSRDKAESASRAKSHFLTNMSHEMRTPLGVIIGFTDLLRESMDSREDMKHGLQIINRNGRHLLSLIDDLLDLSKIEAEKMTLEFLDLPLEQEIQSLVQQFQPKAFEKGLALSFEALTPFPFSIVTDPVRFRQIILNLVGNAIKFTDHGFVKIELSQEIEGEDGEDRLIIDVRDSGCGISSSQVDALFKPFAQADSSTSRKFGGSGLGLALARNLARILDGNVYLLQSEYGKGSTFRISMVLRGAKTSQNQSGAGTTEVVSDPVSSLYGLRVLVVENEVDSRYVLTKYLEEAGANVDVVDNGKQGVISALKVDYDAVLIDMQLPLKDAYLATSEMRKGGFEAPIIALTARTLAEDALNYHRAGFDAFLSKPISWAALTQTIASSCERFRQLH